MLVGAWVTWHKVTGDDGKYGREHGCPPLAIGRDALAGGAVGLLTGFFGVGGGFVVVPALAVALGFPMRSAIGTSLVIVSVVSISGLATHLALGSILHIGVTAAMTAACVAGALAGARLSAPLGRSWVAGSPHS